MRACAALIAQETAGQTNANCIDARPRVTILRGEAIGRQERERGSGAAKGREARRRVPQRRKAAVRMSGGSDSARLSRALAEIAAATDARTVIDALSRYAAHYGFTTVGIGHVVNPQLNAVSRDKVFQLSTWRKEWVEVWAGRNLIIRDPIARYSLLRQKPFRWSEAFGHERTKDKEVEHLIREFGFGDGVTFPMHSDGMPPGAVSLGGDRFELNEIEFNELHLVCVHAYARIEELYGSFPYQSRVRLTVREREILHYVAGGKTNWEIGAILSISQHSVRDHLKAACGKLGADGRAHAVAIALRQGLLLP